MNSRKTFFVMVSVTVLLIGVLLASVIVGLKYLGTQSEALLAAKLDQQSLTEQQAALIKAKDDLIKYADLQKITESIVPQDKDQAKSVREIVRFADESGVTLESISFDDSTLGQQPAAPSAPADGQPSATPAPSLTQAKPVPNIPGVFSLPIIIQSTQNNNQFPNFLSFLEKLENNRRTAQVEKISITPGETPAGKKYINFTLTVNIFVKP